MTATRQERGLDAESAVAEWLTGHGWRLLARRWRVPEGELDLVCLDRAGVLVGVEVRLRSSLRTGDPVGSLTRRHLVRLQRALWAFARSTTAGHGGMRIDLVGVTPVGSSGRWRLARVAGVDAW